jgi:hypothetical protein
MATEFALHISRRDEIAATTTWTDGQQAQKCPLAIQPKLLRTGKPHAGY